MMKQAMPQVKINILKSIISTSQLLDNECRQIYE